ncbi:hypothetical protein ANCCEY_05961 [Ancylostoma ceylanicum]|uniref:Uncharacterized protein n=1 Tax=Ancylostoma ceylanicum TaxID=53326 RepID=A0A0D6LSV4_9BILA|nr:hypothetical protein ANCCEY_05961 [Ancylostoma ceylanicum]
MSSQGGWTCHPSVPSPEFQHAIKSVRNRKALGYERISPVHLKNLPPVLVNTMAKLSTRGREVNMMKDHAPELARRKRAVWGAYKSIDDVGERTKNTTLRAHLFNTRVLSTVKYGTET